MSSLFKRANGVYYVAFHDPERTPSRKTISTRLRKRRDAEKLQSELDAGFELGTFDPFTTDPRDFLRPAEAVVSDGPNLSTLGPASDAFLASRANLRPMTQKRYRSIVERFAIYAGRDLDLSRITTAHVQSFIDSTKTKPVTAHNYRKALATLFRWMSDEGLSQGDPTRAVRLPRVAQKHPRFLKPRDVEAICEAIQSATDKPKSGKDAGLWLLPVVRSNVYLGLRAGEVVNLRWEDVDFDRRTATVRQTEAFSTKAGKDRTIPLASPVVEVLRTVKRRADFVFPSYTGRQLGRQYLSRRFKHFARLARLPEYVNFHSTRHTAASWLAEQGASVEAIRLFLGHSSVTVTQRYMHLSPDAYAAQIGAAFERAAVGGRG